MTKLLEFAGRVVLVGLISLLISQHYSYEYLNSLLNDNWYIMIGFILTGFLVSFWTIIPLLSDNTHQ